MEYGAISLIPPLVMLIFALKTKKSFEALIIGTIVGYIIMYGTDFLQPWCEMLLEECGNRDNLYILLLCGMFAQEQTLLDMGYSTGFDVYYSAVPYMLYPFAALLVVFLFSMGWLP